MNDLEITSEIVNLLIIFFVFTRAIGTLCFSRFEWLMVLIALLFSWSIKYINKKVNERSD